MKKRVYRDKKYELVLEINNDEVTLTKIYYPDTRYLNNVRESIILDTKNRTIYYCEGRENWGGTGSRCTDYVKLSDYTFNSIYDDIMKVKTPSGFDSLALEVQAIIYDLDEDEYYKYVFMQQYYRIRQDDNLYDYKDLD